MKSRYILGLFTLFVCLVTNAQQISDTSFGKGLINYTAKDSTFSVKFAPRIQTRFTSNWEYNGTEYDDPAYNFLVRRARLKFNGFAYSPKLKYKIELGLSNGDLAGANEYNKNTPRYIFDAVIMWNFHENFELWAGQTKLPGNVERIVSSGNMQLIDRSILNSNFNIDRDVGIQLHHTTELGGNFIMKEKLAISQGEGRNVTEGNEGGLQYTGRVEFFPFGSFESRGEFTQGDLKRESTPKLMFALVYDFNNDAVRTRSNSGTYMILDDGSLYQTNITTIFVDTMFKYKGFAFMGEYTSRNADKAAAINPDGSTTGDVVAVGNAFNAQASYLFDNNYELTTRYSTVDFDDIIGEDLQTQYTLGVSKYIVGHKLKVQADISYGTLDGTKDHIMLRTGFDLHF
ncbi:Phosphate-selective porin O and P [unidentified eubacterium SCB49]|nr:Phosphate-selective porin O and P [unidentified eubacterium SCB49]